MKYLYNGHRAPGLPVYDPGDLPYGLIVSANADNTALILMLCVNRPYYGTNPEDSSKTGVYNTGRMLVYTCTDTDEAWTFSTETENPLTANDDDPGGGVLWTLEDILKSDGSVWMAGTQPVPERVSEAWVRSFQEGLALGLTGNPLPYTGTAEPVAFLYNGARLPKLPVVEGYDHAYLCKIWTTGYEVAHLFLTAEPLGITNPKGYITSANVRIDCKSFECNLETGTAWEDDSRTFFMYQLTFEPFWANTSMEEYLWVKDVETTGSSENDVYTLSGEIGLYKSQPVPVYE